MELYVNLLQYGVTGWQKGTKHFEFSEVILTKEKIPAVILEKLGVPKNISLYTDNCNQPITHNTSVTTEKLTDPAGFLTFLEAYLPKEDHKLKYYMAELKEYNEETETKAELEKTALNFSENTLKLKEEIAALLNMTETQYAQAVEIYKKTKRKGEEK